SALDRSRHHDDEDVRRANHARMELLTPVVKAWCTDLGVDIASIGVQVHGGMGFIEETGAAQYLRDSRIAPIYEGTNGIQAIDLLGRKLLRDGGDAMSDLLDEMAQLDEALVATQDADCVAVQKSLADGRVALRKASDWLLDPTNNDIDTKFAGATPFLHMTGTVVGGWLMARAALAAHRKAANSGDRSFLEAKIVTARFYADHVLPRVHALLPEITQGSGSVLALAEDQF
ncbi:MAG: acyl-CoA dehydrogenase, partial [Alphaproteobacteria bacterium]|nr:acyl-CoA dehydrogenase [Alphaproteobacteria bacterium]